MASGGVVASVSLSLSVSMIVLEHLQETKTYC